MEMQMSAFAEDTDRAKQFLELAKKYTDFSELTTPMINEFIENHVNFVLSEMPESLVMHVCLHLSKRSFWLYRSLTPVFHTYRRSLKSETNSAVKLSCALNAA